MLATANRLKNHSDIARALRRGRFYSLGPVTIRSIRNGRSTSRGVVVVSKKISTKATVRNRIRRKLSAAMAKHWQTAEPGYDIVIMVRTNLADVPSDQIDKLATQALATLKT